MELQKGRKSNLLNRQVTVGKSTTNKLYSRQMTSFKFLMQKQA